MQNAFFKRIAAAVIGSVTSLALVAQPLAVVAYSEADAWYDFAANFNAANYTQQQPTVGNQPFGYTTGSLTNFTVTTKKFDPKAAGSTAISMNLGGTLSNLSVVVKDYVSGAVKGTIVNESQPALGFRTINWNGFLAGTSLNYGTYTIEARATDVTGQTQVGSAVIMLIPTSNVDPNISNLKASVYNIAAGQSTTISVDSQATALIRITIFPIGTSVTATPTKTAEFLGSVGTNSWVWNGTNDNGQQVPNGDYKVIISAVNTAEPNVESGSILVTVGAGSTQPQPQPCTVTNTCSTGTFIINAYVSPSTYNPLSGPLQVSYYILGQANVTVTILQDQFVVSTLRNNVLESGVQTMTWDGRYTAGGAFVPSGTYKFRVVATYNNQTDVRESTFTVSSTAGAGFCAGFKDVKVDSVYCNAIVEMQKQGIFTGYTDNTFRPYQSINRAETVKVVMMALKYNVPLTGWYFDAAGFKDVYSGAWYTPYLAAARLYGIISGYPDKTFKPAQTVNRAEMSKIFLEASNIAQQNVPCFEQPYKDKTKATWFGKYACITKYFSLVEDIDGKFAGATPMNRGDVAVMIYRAQVQGLLKNLPPKAQINLYLIQPGAFPFKPF